MAATTSSNYSAASVFSVTNSAEAFQYDELEGLLVSFSKARDWATVEVLAKLADLRGQLLELATVLEGMTPQLQFVRKEGAHRHLVNARGVIQGHIASIADRIAQFAEHPTAARFAEIQLFLAEVIAEDVAKLQRRHTRVVVKASGSSAKRLSSDPSASAASSEFESGNTGSSGYNSRSWGGARRRLPKKLTRRRR